MKIAVEVHRVEEHYLEQLRSVEPDSFEIISAHRFGGEVGVVAALISLTATTVPVLASIVKELIQSRRYVRLKIKGIEISGISEDTVLEILDRLRLDEPTKSR